MFGPAEGRSRKSYAKPSAWLLRRHWRPPVDREATSRWLVLTVILPHVRIQLKERPASRRLILLVACACSLTAVRAESQDTSRVFVRPTSETADRMRLAQLAGDTSTLDAYLLRSPSLLFRRDDRASSWTFHAIRPDVQFINNTAIPFGPNTGVMWAQRGVSWRLSGGFAVQRGRFRAIVAPDLWYSGNAAFDFTGPLGIDINKPIPETRFGNGFANIWYAQPYSADLPWRTGANSALRLWLGQSGAWYDAGPVEIGVTSENMWWGPGIQNAIVMSDNAAGVPRIELRTPHPLRTRIGDFEGRWFVGALSESQYFDTAKTNDVRSLAGAALTWRPVFQPNLTLGVTRAVFATASGYGRVPFRWLNVFASTGHPADRAPSDSSLTPGGKDQLFSLFGRWVLPRDGFEFYAEWARQQFPASLHELVVAPSLSSGYTVGLQYRTPVPLTAPAYRLQFEVTNLEPSAAARDHPEGVFYTSRRVIQGYTELGKVIGAAIGPGSSSQWLAIDRVWPTASVGVTLNRIRWDEGVRAARVWPAYLGDCNQDVSIIPGLRGGHVVGDGYISANLQVATRLNYHFQNVSGCFGTARVDVHNTTLSISYSPFSPFR